MLSNSASVASEMFDVLWAPEEVLEEAHEEPDEEVQEMEPLAEAAGVVGVVLDVGVPPGASEPSEAEVPLEVEASGTDFLDAGSSAAGASGAGVPGDERCWAEGTSVKSALPVVEGMEQLVEVCKDPDPDPLELPAVGSVAVGESQVLVAEKAAEVQVDCWCWAHRESWGCLCYPSLVHDPWVQILHVD